MAFCAPDEMDDLKAIQKVMKLSIPVASGRAWENHEIPEAPKKGGRGRGRGGRPGGAPRGAGGEGAKKPNRNRNRRRRGGGGGGQKAA